MLKSQRCKNIIIRHNIGGRLRVSVPCLKYSGYYRREWQKLCAGIAGVIAIRNNMRCCSTVLVYDAEITGASELLSKLESHIKLILEGEDQVADSEHDSVSAPESLAKAWRFGALSFISAGAFVCRTILKLSIGQTLLSPLGAAVTVFTLPLIGRAMRDTAHKKRLSLHTFLGGSCLLAVIMGEALTALEILWITEGAELLKSRITEKSRNSIRSILEVAENEVFILKDGVEVAVSAATLQAGEIIVLHTGEKIPADATVIAGSALVNESAITGNSLQVSKNSGDRVLSGTMVEEGLIRAEITAVGADTYLSYILRQVEDNLGNKASIELIADKLAQRLVYIGFAATGLTYLVTASFMRALTVLLVMACPCATVLAASSAITAALRAAARRGILIKGGRYLEVVTDTSVYCFDKTGTLTSHEPELTRIIELNDFKQDEILRLALSAELHNQHPLARAIRHEAQKRGIKQYPHTECDFVHGKGVRAVVGEDVLYIGSYLFMEESGVYVLPYKNQGEELSRHGMMVTYVASNYCLAGIIGFENCLRPELYETLQALRSSGVEHLHMLTGDSRFAAEYIAERYGFDCCHHTLLPHQKDEIIRSLQNSGFAVVMVGDGINDGLALVQADVGIAMGVGGTDVALEAADIVLINDSLADLAGLRVLSGKTRDIIRQNFVLATGTNVIGAVMAAAGYINPLMAGLLHIGHTLGILVNSSRLLNFPETGGDFESAKVKAISSEVVYLE